MNLWARTLRQLTIASVALFFFSCDDESGLLGFRNQKFDIRYVDIPLAVESSQVMVVDSLITDLRPSLTSSGQTQLADGILVGQVQDPDFGTVTAQPFLSVYALSSTALNSTAVFDSVTVQMRLNFFGYGFSGQKEFRIPVHEITGDTLTLYDGKRYYANSTPPEYNPEPLGEAVVVADYDFMRLEADSASTSQDTLLAVGRLNDEYGMRIFNAIKSGFANAEAQKIFRAQIKGLTFAPPAEEGILGFNVITSFGQLSRVRVHYHTLADNGDVKDTLVASLGFEYAGFTKIDVDRAGTELATALPYEPLTPSNNRSYIQSGGGVVTRIDLAPYYSFTDTVENIILNSAELVIENIAAPAGFHPHRSLMLRMMSNATPNQFLNARVAADREVAGQYYVVTAGDQYYLAATEGPAVVTINYDEDKARFSGPLTLFAQSLYANKKNINGGVNEDRLRYLSLVPANPQINRSVARTLFNNESVKLRIYYTKAKTVTP